MEAIRQIYECSPAVISVPPALRNRRIEIIIWPLDEEPVLPASNGDTELILDAGALEFAGCLPDFPEREPQGEYEIREELP
jgi:hypothetical protein